MKFGLSAPEKAIEVRVYQSSDPKKAAKEFEKEANDMLAKGFEVLHVTAAAGRTGAAAIGLGAYTVLTVTYRRLALS